MVQSSQADYRIYFTFVMSLPHFQHLQIVVPDLKERHILDLGSGRGGVLVEATKEGFSIEGLEYSARYIELAEAKAKERGVVIKQRQGKGEALPYDNQSFGFVNMAEVIEHVEEPEAVMKEVYRVLKPGGSVYLSVPSRYGAFDPHFKIYGVNWVPRAWSDRFISIFGKHKEYTNETGEQRLSHMHYYTLGAIRKLLREVGYSVYDIRELKIKQKLPKSLSPFALMVYRLVRSWYFNTYHLLPMKPL